MIRIIVVEPKKEAYTMLVDENTNFIEKLVGKHAVHFRPYDDPVAIIHCPDNKALKMPKSRAYTELVTKNTAEGTIDEEHIVNFFYGRFIIIQEDENKKPTKFDSVLCRAYKALFFYPESFRRDRGHWRVSEYHQDLPTRRKNIAI